MDDFLKGYEARRRESLAKMVTVLDWVISFFL